MQLDKVVVPGGGQNDLWHSLNCKGRYAGEIRIELTYYDTRPKEEKPPEAQASPTAIANKERGGDTVGGPRQSKPVKRRPLPADPTSASPSPQRPLPADPILASPSPQRPAMPDHTQSSPLPYTPQRGPPQAYDVPIQSVHESIDYGHHSNRQSPQFGYDATESSAAHNPYYHDPHSSSSPNKYHQDIVPMPQLEQYHSPHDVVNSIEPDYGYYQEGIRDTTYSGNQQQHPSEYQQDPNLPAIAHQQHVQQDFDLPPLPEYDSRHSRPSVQPVSNQHIYGGSHSSPADTLPQHRPISDRKQQRQHQAPDMRSSGRNGYDSSPLRHQSFDHVHDQEPPQPKAILNGEGPPPPPPAHRSSVSQPLSHISEHKTQQIHPPITAPAPLNIRHGRGSVHANPPPQYDGGQSSDGGVLSASPSNTQLSAYSAPSVSSVTSYSPPARRQSQGPVSFSADDHYSQEIPPSLVPGYDPSIAEAESARVNHEKRMSTRPRQGFGPSPIYTASPAREVQQRRIDLAQYENSSPVQMHDRSPIQDPDLGRGQIPRYNHNSPGPPQERYAIEPRAHRASAPMSQPRAISPDPRIPIRKSVSPQPEASPYEQRKSPIPFSPDSYEEFNPNLRSASSINKSGAKYNTPDQAKNAARQREQEEKLEEGPIIGNDGRIIDPSDHLPTETWAPEPEPKVRRKGPEITFRFRNSPQGAQPMPNTSPRPPRETVIRPQSSSTTTHTYSRDPTSPTTATTRARLQKKSYVSGGLPASSPAIPTVNSNSSSPLPLREHVDYGYSNSPSYSRNSPVTVPPPIPAKVALLGSGQEDWGSSALSEEMKRIDIGVGAGSGSSRVRRSRFGA